MAATIEEALSHVFYGEIVHRAEAHPDATINTIILTQRDTAFHTFDLQWDIDKSLRIATYKVEILHIFTCQRIIACMKILEDVELLRHEVTTKTDGPSGIVVEHIAVDLVLVDALSEQLTDDEEYLRTCRGESEASCVCHHATVVANSKLL